ncbi:unnamed protein product [Blepharisma stoltei]|uniref:CCT domain-containing protein n=1 Tax=Blepharisma stoltei TaxID=1481888 RepID=A0AAU9IW29_9CILI|nr:unnamed protein product [Blepharisma stoltei]
MEEQEEKIVVPIALHWNSIEPGLSLIAQLSNELLAEREKCLQLSKELESEKLKYHQLESCLSSISQEGTAKMPRTESWNSIASTTADFEDEKPLVGIYPPHIREQKILRYKMKLQRYRQKVKISRSFQGRSETARHKLRVKGKFVKSFDNNLIDL